MLSWGVILHGAALSVVVAIALAVLLGRERRPAILVTIAAGTLAGSIAWNAIPRRADRRRYFTDAPSRSSRSLPSKGVQPWLQCCATLDLVRWDPDQYRRFGNERDRAFLDLTSRIGADAPRHVVDVGCGPGNLTGLLASRWPQAVIEGIDSSPEMIAAAADVPRVSFAVGDAADWQPARDVDVVVSNAALQWIPRHQELMAKWASALPCGGWLAVQVPGNFDSPSHALMRSLADNARWSPALHTVVPYTDAVGAPESYAALLLDAGLVADVWEATYLHLLQGEDPVLEWLRGAGLRPLLAALSPHDAQEFSAQLGAELRHAYPPGPHGTVFPVPRVFAVGHKP